MRIFFFFVLTSVLALAGPTPIYQLQIPSAANGNPAGTEEVFPGANETIDLGGNLTLNGTLTLSATSTIIGNLPAGLVTLTGSVTGSGTGSVPTSFSSGTTGSGTVVLAASPTLTGTVTAPLFSGNLTGTATTASAPSALITVGDIIISGGPNFADSMISASSVVTLTNTATLTNKTLTAPVLTSPILGTPASGNLTNCTGFSAGNLSGLGAGVATALGTAANGSGAISLTTSPVFVTPSLGAATASSINGTPIPTSVTLAALGATQTFTGTNTFGTASANLLTASMFNGNTLGTSQGAIVTTSGTQTLVSKTLTSPTLTTPALGVATATSINGTSIPTTSGDTVATLAGTQTFTAPCTFTNSGYYQRLTSSSTPITGTTPVAPTGGLTMTLPAGTYLFSGEVFLTTASTTSGGTWNFATKSGDNSTTSQLKGVNAGGATIQGLVNNSGSAGSAIATFNLNDFGGGTTNALQSFSGVLIVASTSTYTPTLNQQTLDASNGLSFLFGSWWYFQRIR